jgi:predicted NUDIX family NTP pyrophosphohydrolase
MPTVSAGLLLYRVRDGSPEILLVHPGGPFFAKKDDGAWSIPKGEVAPGEDLLAAARREFAEETGLAEDQTMNGPFVALGQVRQQSGKIVHAWACAGDCDPAAVRSNTFEIEWPPRSGQRQSFPEVDRGAFFDLETARRKINPAQASFLDRLNAALKPTT